MLLDDVQQQNLISIGCYFLKQWADCKHDVVKKKSERPNCCFAECIASCMRGIGYLGTLMNLSSVNPYELRAYLLHIKQSAAIKIKCGWMQIDSSCKAIWVFMDIIQWADIKDKMWMDTNCWKRVKLERNECRYVYAECFSFIKSFINADMCRVFFFFQEFCKSIKFQRYIVSI